MKKYFFALMAAFTFTMAHAQNTVDNNYDEVDNSTFSTESEEKESFSCVGLGFYSYDGFENYGVVAGSYTFNGFGFSNAIRMNFEKHGNWNWDLLFNYSYGAYQKDDLMVLITGELGPSFRMQQVLDGFDKNNHAKYKDKFFVDAFVGVKGTVKYKKLVLSAGYHLWAPKFKFGKDYRSDGFYAQLSYCFNFL